MRIDVSGIGRELVRVGHADFMAGIEEVEQLGFAGIWFSEFHFQDPAGPYPSILLLAAAVLARTTRLRVGTAVIVLPLHDPLQLAEQIVQLDWQSGGRIDIGLGRGTDPATMRAMGIDPAGSRQRFEVGLDLLRQALLGRAVVTGIDGRRRPMPVQPPIQRPHPPLYIAGYTPETMDLAGRQNLPLLLSLEPPEGEQVRLYREAAVRAGFASRLRDSVLHRYVVIGATQAEAVDRFERLRAVLHERRVYFEGLRGVPSHHVDNPSAEQLLSDRVIMGDARACIEQIVELCADTGISHLNCIFNGDGAYDREDAKNQMRLFAREVLPSVQSGRADQLDF